MFSDYQWTPKHSVSKLREHKWNKYQKMCIPKDIILKLNNKKREIIKRSQKKKKASFLQGNKVMNYSNSLSKTLGVRKESSKML